MESLFNTNFLRKVLTEIAETNSSRTGGGGGGGGSGSCSRRRCRVVVHVGSVESWPESLNRGDRCGGGGGGVGDDDDDDDDAVMIFNNEHASQLGEHWLAVRVDGERRRASIFDSMPVVPFPNEILRKLGEVCDEIINTNEAIVQDPFLPLCGLYCLTFLEHKLRGAPLALRGENTTRNDLYVLSCMWPYICKLFD